MTTQRKYMRKLFVDLDGDKSRVCAAYARAERNGLVTRNRNNHEVPPENYAVALWNDGVKKGWLGQQQASSGSEITPGIPPESGHVETLSVPELLVLHAQIGEELRERGIVRSANNPTGDLAEYLFCRAFNWRQSPNSERGYDATGPDGTRYQIKGRRIHRRNKSRQLSAIRDIEKGHFQVLAAVLFDDNYQVIKAALVPAELVLAKSTFIKRTNSNMFMLRDDVWTASGVREVTADIIRAMP